MTGDDGHVGPYSPLTRISHMALLPTMTSHINQCLECTAFDYQLMYSHLIKMVCFSGVLHPFSQVDTVRGGGKGKTTSCSP